MTAVAVECRLCGGTQVSRLGRIPDSDFFAGRVIAPPMHGGSLWQCATCRSMFRHPILGAAAYLALYAGGVAEAWHFDSARQDLAIVRGIIGRKAASGRVLDVGCGSGGFLTSLPAGLEKFGVEPSVASAAAATHLGVSILGHTLADLPPESRFDVITVIDVIEHVADPAALMDDILPHLAPHGCLIVATGDPQCAAWRKLFRARFWYSSFPEHISFPSQEFFRIWQQRHGLPPPVVVRTRYRRLPLWHRTCALIAQTAYLVSPACLDAIGRGLQWLHRKPAARRRHFAPAGLGVFTDHQVVTLQAGAATRSPAS